MNTAFAITLTPNSFESRPKSYTLGEKEFKKAVTLVEKRGLRRNFVGGIDKNDVAPFAQNLREALEHEVLADEERRALEGLVEYLTGDGAGVRGLSISRGWKKWNQV